jgi:hypothetical protein
MTCLSRAFAVAISGLRTGRRPHGAADPGCSSAPASPVGRSATSSGAWGGFEIVAGEAPDVPSLADLFYVPM